MSKKARATLHDVADAAGVSYQTVSRVINNSPNVANDTRKKVLRAIQALDYTPNHAARMLSTNRSHTLQVITLNVWISVPAMLQGIITTAEARGYQVVVSAFSPNELFSALRVADRRLADGVLLVNPLVEVNDSALLEIAEVVPFVQIGGDVGSKIGAVMYDQRLGARLAAQHLIDLGHRQLAEITGAVHFTDAQARHMGWVETLAANNIAPDLSVEGRFTARSGYQAMKTLLDSGARFTGVFAANDAMAFGAMLALREHGLLVPEDVSVVGFDDLEFAAYYAPPLTTLRQDWGLLGRLSVEHLLNAIEQPDIPSYQRVIQPELLIRNSTRRI